MKIIRSRGVGFFADFCDAIRQISIYDKQNEPWFIYWGPESCYFDSEREGNAWEYYFENPNKWSEGENVANVPDLVLKDNFNFRDSMNYYISKFITLNKDVAEQIAANEKGFNDILGLHLRRTDKHEAFIKHGEPVSSIPVELEKINEVVEKTMSKKKLNKIYLATDDNESFDFFKSKYGKDIISINAFRSSGNESIHQFHKNISGYKKGLDAVLDAWFLSKCSFLVRSTSNLSAVSLFLNKNLKHINVNEVLKDDKREHEFNLISEKI